jgi:hypothetical protein
MNSIGTGLHFGPVGSWPTGDDPGRLNKQRLQADSQRREST